MYWCDGVTGDGKVYEANLDGSDRREVGSSSLPSDIVLYRDYLYWADTKEGSLYIVDISEGPDSRQYIGIPFKEPKLAIHMREVEEKTSSSMGLAVGMALLGFFVGTITISCVFVVLGKMHDSKTEVPVTKVNSIRESRKIRKANSTRGGQRMAYVASERRPAAALPDPDSPYDERTYDKIDPEYINANIKR